MTSIVFLDRDSLPTAVPPLPLPHRWQDYPATSPEQLLSHARGAQVLISNKVPLRAEHFAQLPELKLVAVAATGVNQIDLDAARAHGVVALRAQPAGIGLGVRADGAASLVAMPSGPGLRQGFIHLIERVHDHDLQSSPNRSRIARRGPARRQRPPMGGIGSWCQ